MLLGGGSQAKGSKKTKRESAIYWCKSLLRVSNASHEASNENTGGQFKGFDLRKRSMTRIGKSTKDSKNSLLIGEGLPASTSRISDRSCILKTSFIQSTKSWRPNLSSMPRGFGDGRTHSMQMHMLTSVIHDTSISAGQSLYVLNRRKKILLRFIKRLPILIYIKVFCPTNIIINNK